LGYPSIALGRVRWIVGRIKEKEDYMRVANAKIVSNRDIQRLIKLNDIIAWFAEHMMEIEGAEEDRARIKLTVNFLHKLLTKLTSPNK
jgi:hypothetical protein